MFHCPPVYPPPVPAIDAGMIGFVFGVGFASLFFFAVFASFFRRWRP